MSLCFVLLVPTTPLYGSVADQVSAAAAFLALAVSVWALYRTTERAADLELTPGDQVSISHYVEGNASVTLNVDVTNDGARVGSVRRLGLIVRPWGTTDAYLLEPVEFQRINPEGRLVWDTLPGSITVGPNSSMTKTVRFRSSERANDFAITAHGPYHFRLLWWPVGRDKPRVSHPFEVHISTGEADTLRQAREEKRCFTVTKPHSGAAEWAARPLAETEIASLLAGGNPGPRVANPNRKHLWLRH